MIPEETHPLVGSAIFEYCHREGGTRTRYSFNIHFGESPDFDKARRQMHGAHCMGISHAVFEVDTGAVIPADEWPEFHTVIFAGRTTSRVTLRAKNHVDAMNRCREIGGLWMPDMPFPGRATRVLNVLKYWWRRRPVIRRANPLDCFL